MSVNGVFLQKAVMAAVVVLASYQGLCNLGRKHLVCSRLPVVAQHYDEHRIAARMQPGCQGVFQTIPKLLQLASTEDC